MSVGLGSQARRPVVAQLLFDDLLAAADHRNLQEAEFRRAGASAPKRDALEQVRALLADYHDAVLELDRLRVMEIRQEVHAILVRENGGRSDGILASNHSPGTVLGRATTAPPGEVPQWGQSGKFDISTSGVRCRICVRGLVLEPSHRAWWPRFDAHSLDDRRPFISKSGFQQFTNVDVDVEPVAGILPDELAALAIEAFVARHLGGRLVSIDERSRKPTVSQP